ncbi:class I SAM-dependent methyltransferase [Bacillus cereus]|uniref:Class I SAM-dependent methyltransferase n=2 Tax=Bacillus cereus group TaxID=86661 RepID=A0A2B0WT23_BACAN|nr:MULTISPECIES: class I SAM-dependent methyltransferase [Bacillus]KZD37258.1 Ribosomal RNA small subunit methyltransferase C [Bacillus cereus]MBJ8061530.1 class I SAM-dependent methyltransferase [Bacillus cereus]MCU4759115.1 class I SAM-dependent methyltransferase [Bacillus cereus]MCU4992112.1 class I SAM-dependent methyltransferase [Bacillus cereus]MCU5109174.1 class I SAM-dependent methyltransferase [Bacillus cereus]
MADHYFSNDPSSKSDRKRWEFTLRGSQFTFLSDRGVFSKNEVDFGSRLLIEAFQVPDIKGDILDVGCGYGPIGLSLAKEFQDRKVHMVDVNERALELAKENAANNRIGNVHISQSSVYENVDGMYAAILSNPPIRAGKDIVHEILEKAVEYLVPGGELWIVIQKKQGAPSALKKLEEVFSEVEVVEKKKGYYIIKSKKR